MTTRLNQVIAVEKGIKTRVYSDITTLHKMIQKPELFNGFTKTYRKKHEDGDDFPNESKKVQIKSSEVILKTKDALTEHFDITATKDFSNCEAKADVTVDGLVLLEGAPTPFLIFLEKQFTDFKTLVTALPVLDSSEDWKRDDQTGLHKTEPVSTHRTKKVQRPIVLYDATPEHPAQTQLISEDTVIGHWETIKLSGAIPETSKLELLKRIGKLLDGIKFAREKANATKVEHKRVADSLFDYLIN